MKLADLSRPPADAAAAAVRKGLWFLPRRSSPAVSLEGATLTHRLVNLQTETDSRVNKAKKLSLVSETDG